jgi:hypothetical protein
MKRRATLTILAALPCLLLTLYAAIAFARPQDSSSNNQAAPASSSAPTKVSSSKTVSASDIATAKASGKVWVNLDSGVYHKGGRWYGKTKNGKFMTVDEAKKAGYKAAKRD